MSTPFFKILHKNVSVDVLEKSIPFPLCKVLRIFHPEQSTILYQKCVCPFHLIFYDIPFLRRQFPHKYFSLLLKDCVFCNLLDAVVCERLFLLLLNSLSRVYPSLSIPFYQSLSLSYLYYSTKEVVCQPLFKNFLCFLSEK